MKAFQGNEPDIQWEDMPRFFADVQPKSPFRGNVYGGGSSGNSISRSSYLLAPKSFSQPIRISTHAGLPRDDNGGLVGFVGVVGVAGSIYASWNDGNTITFTESRDGGKTFSPSRAVVDVAPPYFGGADGIPGVSRAMGFGQIGVDAREGKLGGTLYLACSDFRNGDRGSSNTVPDGAASGGLGSQ